jgi:predicted TIM-barrel enzyme
MADVGADIIVAHMGLTTGGAVGARTAKALDDCVGHVQAIIDASKGTRPEIIVLCHGGPIASPADVQVMLDRCSGLDGFYGASSLERLPTETALTREVKTFAALRLGAQTGSPRQFTSQNSGLPAR